MVNSMHICSYCNNDNTTNIGFCFHLPQSASLWGIYHKIQVSTVTSILAQGMICMLYGYPLAILQGGDCDAAFWAEKGLHRKGLTRASRIWSGSHDWTSRSWDICGRFNYGTSRTGISTMLQGGDWCILGWKGSKSKGLVESFQNLVWTSWLDKYVTRNVPLCC